MSDALFVRLLSEFVIPYDAGWLLVAWNVALACVTIGGGIR